MSINCVSKIILVVFVLFSGCHRDNKASLSKTIAEQDDTLTMFKLNKYNKADYCIYILYQEPLKIKNQFQEKQGRSFYLCDASLIKTTVENFKGIKSEGILMCGYDYEVVFTSKNRIVETASINSMCGFAITGKGAFFFNQTDFDSLIVGMKEPIIKQFYPKNINEARILWKENTQVVNYAPVVGEPDWLRYDGEFYLKLDSYYSESELSKLRAVIQLRYLADTFAFDNWISIKSTNDFYRRYDLTDKEQWEPYSEFNFSLVYKE